MLVCTGAAAKAPTADGNSTFSAAKPEGKATANAAGPSLAEKAAARPQPSQIPGPARPILPGPSRSLLPSSRLAPEGQIVSLKDLVAVMEHHPIYCKSDHLYQLYDRLDGP